MSDTRVEHSKIWKSVVPPRPKNILTEPFYLGSTKHNKRPHVAQQLDGRNVAVNKRHSDTCKNGTRADSDTNMTGLATDYEFLLTTDWELR